MTQLNKNYQHVLDERAKKYIHFAVDGAVRMRQIILDLLDYSRVGRLNEEAELIDLNSVVEEVLILFKKIISDKGALISSDKLPVIKSNRSPLRQLFQNLLNNALTYSSNNRVPTIHLSVTDEQTSLAVFHCRQWDRHCRRISGKNIHHFSTPAQPRRICRYRDGIGDSQKNRGIFRGKYLGIIGGRRRQHILFYHSQKLMQPAISSIKLSELSHNGLIANPNALGRISAPIAAMNTH